MGWDDGMRQSKEDGLCPCEFWVLVGETHETGARMACHLRGQFT